MLLNVVSLFLGVSLILYAVLAGADFGAGILEIFLGREKRQAQREIITHAMAPVWEANHVWLILALVILFNGFPKAFSEISVYFHIPLTFMLFGIILRGCAFTFRHYDAVKDHSQKYYDLIFKLSSLITPFTLGVIAGGLTLGKINPLNNNYYSLYLAPWLNTFCFSLGIFVCTLFSYLAAVYLCGETADPALRKLFLKKIFITNILAVLVGLSVFLAAELNDLSLIYLFFTKWPTVLAMVLATLLLPAVYFTLKKGKVFLSRFIVASQIGLVLLGWFQVQYPSLLVYDSLSGVEPITLLNSAAPELSLKYLVFALLGGSAVIFPSLFYLFRIFKKTT